MELKRDGKNLLLIIILILFLFITSITGVFAVGPNLISNPSFETGDFTNWTKIGTAGSILANSGNAYNGTYKVVFQNPTTAYSGRGLMSDNMTITSNTNYTLQGWFRVVNETGLLTASNIRLYVQWYDSTQNLISTGGYTTVQRLSAFDTWQILLINVTSPASAVKAAVFTDVQETVNNDNDIWTDLLSFSLVYSLPQIQLVSPSETSGSYTSRNWILANVTATNTNLDAILKNVTIFLYNSTKTLINSTNSTTSPLYVNFTGLSNGEYYFNATACDTLNQCNTTDTRNITIDTISPVINVTSPLNQTYNITQILINFTASDNFNVSSLWFYNESTNVTYFSPVTLNLLESSHTFIFYANDSVGNLNSTSVTFFIDTCIPNMQNTTWSDWANQGSCKIDDLQLQNKSRTEYDSNSCDEISNVTYWDYQNIICDYCYYNIVNSSLTDWENITCLADSTMNQTRNKIGYDENYGSCYAITNLQSDLWNSGNNITYLEFRNTEICTQNNPSMPISSGGSGGSCSYSWNCTGWGKCSSEGKQTRICRNTGTCSDTYINPKTDQNCTYNTLEKTATSEKVLLGIGSTITNSQIILGENLSTKISLINLGNKTNLNVTLYYIITDLNNHTILLEKEIVLVESQQEFIKEFILPFQITLGEYNLFIIMNYDGQEKEAVSKSLFEIIPKTQITPPLFAGQAILTNLGKINYRTIDVPLTIGVPLLIVISIILVGYIFIKEYRKEKIQHKKK